VAKALPNELRERALEAREREGLSIAETAARFMVGTASVKRWNKRMKSTGSVAPSPVGGVRRIWIGDDDKAKLVALVETMADATIEELRAEYNSRHDCAVSPSAMHRTLQRFDLTRKKSPSTPPRHRPIALSPLARPTPFNRPR
jgi:transposase